jgi:hypothetical protein
MADRLLQRQARLVEHLTSSAGIFGAVRGRSNDPTLHGLDLALLHLEARLSHEKRMQKIEWVLTRSLELLGHRREVMIREFVEACPPTGISWLGNARQFHAFLKARWQCEPPVPAHLPDIAAYEIAYATVRAGERHGPAGVAAGPAGTIRRHPAAVLLCFAHDIRPFLEVGGGNDTPALRETRLAVTMLPGSDEPQVSELSRDLFEMLEMLDRFIDPSIFHDMPDAEMLIQNLAAGGLIEVHP